MTQHELSQQMNHLSNKKARKYNEKLFKKYIKANRKYKKGDICKDGEGKISVESITYTFSNVDPGHFIWLLYTGRIVKKNGKLSKKTRTIHEKYMNVKKEVKKKTKKKTKPTKKVTQKGLF